MRLMLIVTTIAVAMLLDLRVSQATQMPWCAGTSKSISGIARGEQADKMKDILGRVYEYPLCAEWNR